jgi:cytochrome c nitrite reductase small subunit
MGKPFFSPRRLKWLKILTVMGTIAAGAGLFVAFGPPGLYAKSAEPEFCASCHVMETHYEMWFHNGGHRNLRCVECHLPNDNPINHLTWKSIDGMKDVWLFYSGKVPERIRLTAHGEAVLEENCRRCHAQLVSLIKEDRRCWDCHRRLSHLNTGAM